MGSDGPGAGGGLFLYENAAMGSYAFNFQVFGQPAPFVSGGTKTDGYDTASYPTSLDGRATLTGSFPDGAATTIAFTEKLAQCHDRTPTNGAISGVSVNQGSGTAWAFHIYGDPYAANMYYIMFPTIAYGPEGALGPGNYENAGFAAGQHAGGTSLQGSM